MHKLAVFNGCCRGCKQAIHANQIIVKHQVRSHLWVHAGGCMALDIAPSSIVCYV
jgi:hypothetical protein